MKKKTPILIFVLVLVVGALLFFWWLGSKNQGIKFNFYYPKESDREISHSYFERGGKVYYHQQTCFDCGSASDNMVLVAGADPDTFKDLGGGFAIDKRDVYCQDYKKLSGADPKTFSSLSGTELGKDKNFVYIYCRKIGEGINTVSFKSKGGGYFADKNTVYFLGYNGLTPIQYSDPDSFLPLSYNYSKDKDSVYYEAKKIEGFDIETYFPLTYYYFKDKNYVYYRGQKIEGVDPNTFQETEYKDARYSGKYFADKNYVIFDGKIIDEVR